MVAVVILHNYFLRKCLSDGFRKVDMFILLQSRSDITSLKQLNQLLTKSKRKLFGIIYMKTYSQMSHSDINVSIVACVLGKDAF